MSFIVYCSHYGQVRTSDKIIEAAKTGNLSMVIFHQYHTRNVIGFLPQRSVFVRTVKNALLRRTYEVCV